MRGQYGNPGATNAGASDVCSLEQLNDEKTAQISVLGKAA